MNEECQCQCQQEKSVAPSIVQEISDYRHNQTLQAVNRDGDMLFIECPSCHSTEVNALKLFGCRNCHTRFSVYPEDGFASFYVETEGSPIHPSGNTVTLLRLRPNDFSLKIHLPRNDGQIAELKKTYPQLKVVKLARDLHDGKDAHGHQPYKRYALIPLD